MIGAKTQEFYRRYLVSHSFIYYSFSPCLLFFYHHVTERIRARWRAHHFDLVAEVEGTLSPSSTQLYLLFVSSSIDSYPRQTAPFNTWVHWWCMNAIVYYCSPFAPHLKHNVFTPGKCLLYAPPQFPRDPPSKQQPQHGTIWAVIVSWWIPDTESHPDEQLPITTHCWALRYPRHLPLESPSTVNPSPQTGDAHNIPLSSYTVVIRLEPEPHPETISYYDWRSQ